MKKVIDKFNEELIDFIQYFDLRTKNKEDRKQMIFALIWFAITMAIMIVRLVIKNG